MSCDPGIPAMALHSEQTFALIDSKGQILACVILFLTGRVYKTEQNLLWRKKKKSTVY